MEKKKCESLKQLIAIYKNQQSLIVL